MPQTATVTAQAIVLGLIAFAAERGVKSFPPNDDQRWHLLLYDVKKKLAGQFPAISLGRFDWDRSYPTSTDLDTMYMSTLLYCGTDRSFRLRPDCDLRTVRATAPFLEDPELAEKVFELAQEIEGFFGY